MAEKSKGKMATSMGQVCEHFAVSRRTVQGWMSAGCPGTTGGAGVSGKYDLHEIDEWLRLNGRGPYSGPAATSTDASASKADLERAKLAEDIEWRRIRNAERKGELVERAAVLAEVATVCATIRSRLEAIPEEAAATVAPEQRVETLADWKHKVGLALKELEGMADA